MTKLEKICGCLILSLLLSACAAPNRHIQAWLDEGMDFSKYRTYDIIPVQVQHEFEKVNTLLDTALRQAMNDRGYLPSNGSGDLIVRYMTRVEHSNELRPELTTTPSGPTTEYQMVAVNEGSILINVIDRATGQVVWKGSSLRNLNNLNRKKITQVSVNEGVRELFSSFPSL